MQKKDKPRATARGKRIQPSNPFSAVIDVEDVVTMPRVAEDDPRPIPEPWIDADTNIEHAIEERPVEMGPLANLAAAINGHLQTADRSDVRAMDQRIAAAYQMVAAKNECQRLGIRFMPWAMASIKVTSDRTIQELVKIGSAADPAAALAEMRDRNAARNRRHRSRLKSGEPAPRLAIGDRGKYVSPPAVTPVGDPTGSGAQRSGDGPSAGVDGPPPAGLLADDTHLENTASGLDASGYLHSLPLLDTQQRRVLADQAASGLPADDVRLHVEALAKKVGLVAVRSRDSKNYHVTVEGLMADYARLPLHQQTEFLRRIQRPTPPNSEAAE